MPNKSAAFFSYTFRPFFLFAGIFAIVAVIGWMLILNGSIRLPLGTNPVYWHGHEMIVGFALAVVAGFVLSAVATWTGRPAVSGPAVMWLGCAWLLGRIAVVYAGAIPLPATATLDMLFPLSLCYYSAREIFGARNKRNYKIIMIVCVIALVNLAYHVIDPNIAIYMLIHAVLLLVALIGGRIVPSFTANWLRGQGVTKLPGNNLILDRMAITLTILVGIAVVFYPERALVGYLAISAAALHTVRISQWRGLQTLRNPLLFILHVAYAWLPIGYAMMGMAGLGLIFTPTTALHALTMGAIGTMVFAMLTRVPLGHTGRPLHVSWLVVVAYVVLTFAIIVRIVSPWAQEHYLGMVNLAAGSWCLAFAIFLWVYWPVLTRPSVTST